MKDSSIHKFLRPVGESSVDYSWYIFLWVLLLVASFLTAKVVSLLLRGKVCDACVWKGMLCRNETWSLERENELALRRPEMRMIRRM